MKNISVIGSGSFGCALAHILDNKNKVKMWSYTKKEMDSINNKHQCFLLPSIKMSPKVKCYMDYQEALEESDIIILVSPSSAIRNTCQDIKPYIKKQDIVIASKGMEKDKVLSQIVKEELNIEASILSGPAHAEELARNLFTFVNYSGNLDIIPYLETDYFRLEAIDDKIGVQVGAALKNVISLGIGICDALGYEKNTMASYIVKGLNEIKEIGLKLGGKEQTFYGLSGLGDLLATSFSENSRNKKAGMLLCKGLKNEEIVKQIGMVVEGFGSLKDAKYIMDKYQLDLPLIKNLYEIVFENKNVHEIIK